MPGKNVSLYLTIHSNPTLMKPSAILTIEGNSDNKIYMDRVEDLDKLMAFLYAFNEAWINEVKDEIERNQVFTNFNSGSKKLVGLLQSVAFQEVITDGLDPVDQVPLYRSFTGWDLLPFEYSDEISLRIKIHLNGMVYITRPKAIEL